MEQLFVHIHVDRIEYKRKFEQISLRSGFSQKPAIPAVGCFLVNKQETQYFKRIGEILQKGVYISYAHQITITKMEKV